MRAGQNDGESGGDAIDADVEEASKQKPENNDNAQMGVKKFWREKIRVVQNCAPKEYGYFYSCQIGQASKNIFLLFRIYL